MQFIFQQVKEIREKYISHLGVSGYGGLIRKICGEETAISLLGYGHLGQKIMPWIRHRTCRVHVRNLEKYKKSGAVELVSIHHGPYHPTVIIAAPIQSEILSDELKNQEGLIKIIDCRSLDEDHSSLKPFFEGTQVAVIELQDLFASIEVKQNNITRLMPQIQNEIRDRASLYWRKYQHRPLGWEDLCG